MNFKDIHIGSLIKSLVNERNVDSDRICRFMKCTEQEVLHMYEAKSIDSNRLLSWSKLLAYDFFRIYSQHLLLYSPAQQKLEKKREVKTNSLPQFRKNIYTQELIDFIMHQIQNGELSKNEVINRYRIPKTTLYKWLTKYQK